MTDRRDRALRDLAADVRELTVEVRLSAGYSRDPGPGRRAARGVYRTTHESLLRQLVANLIPGQTPQDHTSTGKPGSRTPSAEAASSALFDIAEGWLDHNRDRHTGVRGLRDRLRAEAGQPPRGRVTIVASLQEIRALAQTLGEDAVLDAARATRGFVQRARAALAYEAPVVTLRDSACPHCQGDLRVAEDASSDVWCANPECLDEEGRGRSWPRRNWIFLLDQLAPEKTPEVTA